MSSIGDIRIRFELEAMKATIITALHERELEIESAVKAEMDRVIESFDFETVVAAQVRRCLADSIIAFYQHGEGRDYIKAAVAAALCELHEGKREDD